MKKAFYILGAIYFGFKLTGFACRTISRGIDHYYEAIESKNDKMIGKVKQPIGFAYEGIES